GMSENHTCMLVLDASFSVGRFRKDLTLRDDQPRLHLMVESYRDGFHARDAVACRIDQPETARCRAGRSVPTYRGQPCGVRGLVAGNQLEVDREARGTNGMTQVKVVGA